MPKAPGCGGGMAAVYPLHVPSTKRVGKGRRTNLPGVVSVAGFRLLMQAVGPSFFLRRSKVDSTELSDLRQFAQF